MKPRFRQSMNWLHTWGGFAFGWLIYFIFVTGTVGYFENEIDRWMKPEMALVNQTVDEYKLLKTAELALGKLAPDSPQWYIGFPTARSPFVNVSWLQLADDDKNLPRAWRELNLQPETGATIDVRETAGGETLYRMHYNLHYIPQFVGYILTSIAAMLMLIGLLTGLVIHKKIFIEFFTFRAKKGLRSWLDIHNLFSVLPLPFHLMITYSGLLLLMGITMSAVIDARYGEGKVNHKKFYNEARVEIKEQKFINLPANELSLQKVLKDAHSRYENHTVSFVGLVERGTENEHYEVWFDKYEGIHLVSAVEYRVKDSRVEIEVSKGKAGPAAHIYELFEVLHEGLFANIYLRWLYFISGLLGAGMIATGMIIWLKKRKKDADKAGKINFVGLIERANTGVILGVPIAIAFYFWSNRLLPTTMANRVEWEVHCFFIAFLLCVVFCFCRNITKIWPNTLWLAAFSYLFLPVVNQVTSEHSIINSIKTGDWIMLDFDVSMLCFGGCFVLGAIFVNRQNKNKTGVPVEMTCGVKSQNKLKDMQ